MPAVNRERKHNSNPMGKRKHWYVPCIAPALAALLLAGCGATVDLNEQATAETAMAVQWVPNGSVYATAAEELEYWSTAQKLESALAATRETAPSVDLNELLDEFCAAQPGSFSLYLQNPATGESYTYNTDALYYPASLLKLPYAFWLCGQADAGTLDLEDELPNQFRGRLSDTALQAYNDAETIPAKAAPSTEEPGTASQTKYATGKYTQTEVTPAVDSGFAPAKLQMLDGVPTLSLYNDAQNTAAAFSWTGDGWETIDPSTVQAFLDGLDKTQVETLTACYGGSGRWWVAAAETGGALTLYRVDSQGSVRTVLTDTPPAGGTAPYITDFAAAPGYAVVCLADGAGSCVLQIVDGQSGDISATIRPSVVDYTFAVSGNRLYLRNRNAGTMDVYALPSGEKADSFAIVPEAQEVAAYAVDGENQQIVFLTMDGVFQAGFGSSVKQAMVQEKGFVYAAPQTTDYEILPLGDAAFLVSCLQNGAPLTVLIRLDATLPTQAAQSLYIWALEDSDVIRSAAAVFANQYPDCDVQLEFGRDATSQALSDEDIIKNLNTRLLAGEAPDVLFLDGLPIRSLMEKGVLASLDGVVSMDGYYENILTAYSLDGRPYAYPSVFRVPVFVSGSSEINVDDYASLASLAALYQEQSLIFNTSYEDIFDSFYIASSAGLFPEEKRIDEDALRAFLQSTREMIDGQQITAQTNEYVMASGNGQSVAQSEFAMSLIKVAEGSYPCGTGVVSSRSDALKLFWSYPAVAIRPLPGSGFEAKEIVSIPANAANPTLAKAFVQIMLTDPVVQLNSLYKGFSVQRDVENAYLAQTIADGEQTYAADPLTCDWDSLIEELGAPSVSSATIYDVTHEAAFDYYGNEIDLDTAVQRIEENLGLYFSEQQ